MAMEFWWSYVVVIPLFNLIDMLGMQIKPLQMLTQMGSIMRKMRRICYFGIDLSEYTLRSRSQQRVTCIVDL
jgi:hypothetical protein